MKKKVSIAIICLILISMILYMGSIYYGMPQEVCGSGLAGLRVAGVILGVILLGSMLFDLRGARAARILCASCSASMEEDWVVCPYCGSDRKKDSL